MEEAGSLNEYHRNQRESNGQAKELWELRAEEQTNSQIDQNELNKALTRSLIFLHIVILYQ